MDSKAQLASSIGTTTLSGSISRPPAAMTASEKWDAGLDLDFDEREFDDMESESRLSGGDADESLYDEDEKRGRDDIEKGMAKPMRARSKRTQGQNIALKEFLDEKRSFSSDLSVSQSSSATTTTPPYPIQTYPSPPRIINSNSGLDNSPSIPPPAAASSSDRRHSRRQSQPIRVELGMFGERRGSMSEDELSPKTPAPTS